MLQGDGVLERGVNTEALGRRSWPSALRRTAQRSPARENVRVAGGTPYEIWYTSDCSEWTVLRITLEGRLPAYQGTGRVGQGALPDRARAGEAG